MTTEPATSATRGLRRTAGWAAAGGAMLAFALAYTRDPLYAGNANTYVLHGLSLAGVSFLKFDWLARTADPFPAFSALVYLTQKLGHPALLQWFHGALLGVYLLSLFWIFCEIERVAPKSERAALFVCGALVWHSALFCAGVQRVSGSNWAWFLQSGVAWQHLLGFVFQPSLFGVLLVASLAAFLRGRDLLGAVLAGVAAVFHMSYVLPALIVIAANTYAPRVSGGSARRLPVTRAGLVGLAIVALTAAVTAWRFAPSDTPAFVQAETILATVRIPHHALPSHWWGPSLALQLPLVLAGLWLAKGTRLAPALVGLALVALALTGFQVLTGSLELALLFPWRASVLLVPLGTALLWGRAVARFREDTLPLHVALCVAVLAALGAAVYGEVATERAEREYAADPELPLLREIQRTASPTDLYVIPLEMKRFRLETGARTFVDWKSHPYLDREVLEWYRRVGLVRSLRDATGHDFCRASLGLARDYAVTHFILPVRKVVACPGLEQRYRDGRFVSYAVTSLDAE